MDLIWYSILLYLRQNILLKCIFDIWNVLLLIINSLIIYLILKFGLLCCSFYIYGFYLKLFNKSFQSIILNRIKLKFLICKWRRYNFLSQSHNSILNKLRRDCWCRVTHDPRMEWCSCIIHECLIHSIEIVSI